MRFAEVILRVGVALVSWMMIYMHLIMVLVARFAPCAEGQFGPWKVSMVSAVFALAAILAIPFGHGLKGVQGVFRFFALPLLFMLPWAAWTILPVLSAATFGEADLCGGLDMTVPAWQRLWAPLQLVLIGVLGFTGWRAWRGAFQPRA